MSKRSKKNRRAKLALPRQGAKRGSPRLAIFVLAAAIVFSLGLWWWKSRPGDIPSGAKRLTEASAANQSGAETQSDFQKLRGRWQRTDGGYVLEIKSIAANGSVDAGYFNPKSIHVATAEASTEGNAMKVFIELRDVNYPGSTYTLNYDPANDQLKGVYFQAVEKQRFAVAFVRMK